MSNFQVDFSGQWLKYLLWICPHMNVTGPYLCKSTLVQVMAWCRQATSHYLSQCWPRSQSPYGITRPQWVNRILWHGCLDFGGKWHQVMLCAIICDEVKNTWHHTIHSNHWHHFSEIWCQNEHHNFQQILQFHCKHAWLWWNCFIDKKRF